MRDAHFFPSIAVMLAAAMLLPNSVRAQVPDSLGFQGLLTRTDGTALDSAGVSMTFKLYKDGAEIWTETQSVNVSDGVFNVFLGKNTALDTVAFNRPIELGIKLSGESSEMVPRTAFAASPYALGMRGMHTVWVQDGDSSGFNVVGGASNNFFGSGVVGATIGGGGGWVGFTGVPDSVLGDWGTVCGGRSNTAVRKFSSVGGGRWNRAIGYGSTVGGGRGNWADGVDATIGGGLSNRTLDEAGTVGGGIGNIAVNVATVAGGSSNHATGGSAAIPGGNNNIAKGYASFAAGTHARANHDGTFVWQGHKIGSDSLVSTDHGQFLIGAYGGVGIGTNAPSTNLHVYGAGSTDGGVSPFEEVVVRLQGPANTALSVDAPTGSDPLLYFANNGAGIWSLRNDAPSNVFQVRRPGAPTSTITLEMKRESEESWLRPGLDNALDLGTSDRRWKVVYAANGTINTSDGRLKSNVAPLEYGLNELLKLAPIQYRWKNGPGERRLGFVAQDVESVLPEVVYRPKSEEDHYGMNDDELIPVLVRAIQDQQAEIGQLRERIEQVERGRIAD